MTFGTENRGTSITHFCAPAFFLLAGMSAFLMRDRRGLSNSQFALRLAKRGGVLIALDVVLLPALWWFNFDYSLLPLGVLWAIGWSMIVLGAFAFLGVRLIATIGVGMIVLHNCADGLRFDLKPVDAVWCVLHVQTGLQVSDGFMVVTAYPLVPWIGVTLAGYALAATVLQHEERRRTRLMFLGASLIGVFLAIRGTNAYGDPAPWGRQETLLMTVMSMLNCTKYPPSLPFLLMTLGPTLFMLGVVGERSRWWKTPLVILGRTPLFFYFLHIFVFHTIAVGLSIGRYGRADWWFKNPPFAGMPMDYGWDLPMLYAVWLVGVVCMIPLCHVFASRRRMFPR